MRKQPASFQPLNAKWKPAALWNFAFDYDSVSRQESVQATGGFTYTDTPYGRGAVVSGTANLDRYVLNCPREAQDIGADDFSVLLHFTLQGDNYEALGRWNTAVTPGSNDWTIGSDSTFFGGTPTADFAVEVGSIIYKASVSWTWVLGHTYTLIGARDKTTLNVYVLDHDTGSYGTGTTTNAGITTVNYNAGRKLKFGEDDVDPIYNVNLTSYVAATFKYALDVQGAKELLENPWALFYPEEPLDFYYNPIAILAASPVNFYITAPSSDITTPVDLAADPVNFYMTVGDHVITPVELSASPVNFYMTVGTHASTELSFVIFNGTGTADNLDMN